MWVVKSSTAALSEALTDHAITGAPKDPETGVRSHGGLQAYGTNVLMSVLNEAGSLPAKNWTTGYFEGASKISGEVTHELADKAKEKNPNTEAVYAHPCHPGCVIKCIMPFQNPWEGEK